MSSCQSVRGGNSQNQQQQQRNKTRKAQRKGKKVGGSGLEAAIVPFGLFAIQQWFGTRSKSRKSKGGQKKQQQKQSKKKDRKL